MKITTAGGSIQDQKVDTLVVNLFQETKPGGATAAVDEATGGAIARILDLGDFKGELNSTAVVYADGIAADRVVVVGLGKEADFTANKALQAAATAFTKARDLGAKSIASIAFGAGAGGLQVAEAAEATALGAILGLYKFDRYKSDSGDDKKEVQSLKIVEFDRSKVQQVRAGVGDAQILGESVNLARDLVNSPGSDLTPTALANEARAMCKEIDIKCSVYGPGRIRRMNMGALWGVAKGSREEPRFVVMDYEPEGTSRGTLAVCGKGVTFDSGGISIKPGSGMDEMKMDMSGAAATIGILRSAAALEMPVRVVGLIAATENMPDGLALKPGDVLTARSGKTIEVLNTDAEGRLILADALDYAHTFKPDAIVDLATLTGAIIVALGHEATGVMSTSADLVDRLRRAGDYTGERVWELPLWDEYEEAIKGKIADINNTGGRSAGSIAGGMFLKHFAGDVPWAHLDIAGTAWSDKGKPHSPGGATGVGVRLITRLLREWTKPPTANSS
ncbi:MAG: leucyl aminopeptidase [Chloroflexi bacterium]|nr:leucyl aminopeptidase [Chloroflexota bacterium]MCY3938181.1 leucyl aminopeptidase [Chloroflexota bacterium]